MDNRNLSNVSSDTDLITLSQGYSVLLCMVGVACSIYTSPDFKTTNANSIKISSVASTYFANASQWAFGGSTSIAGTSVFSASNSSIVGSQRFNTVILLNCNNGDKITLQINSQFGAKFNGKVSIVGLN